jgi:GTPase SAR1 family protein
MNKSGMKLALVGLPESGKTTFVAALYHIIQQPEHSPALVLTKLPEQSKYLDAIVKTWRDLEPQIKTIDGTFEPIVLSLRDQQSHDEFELLLPDISGEDFDEQWEHHRCRKNFKELIEEVTGILFFVHPNIVVPRTITDRNAVLGEATPKDIPDAKKAYEPKSAPTGIKLVELLQVIQSFLPVGKTIRVAIMVSAWDIELDMLEKERIDEPIKWIEARIPLLYQFLMTNDDWLHFEVFGLSAQGGDLTKDIEKLEALRAHEKVKVVSRYGVSKDITLPIRWAIGH